jgi:hypothetical protein
MHGKEQDTPTTLHSFQIATFSTYAIFPALDGFSTCRFELVHDCRDLTSRFRDVLIRTKARAAD